jgi:hypothetical protein
MHPFEHYQAKWDHLTNQKFDLTKIYTGSRE